MSDLVQSNNHVRSFSALKLVTLSELTDTETEPVRYQLTFDQLTQILPDSLAALYHFTSALRPGEYLVCIPLPGARMFFCLPLLPVQAVTDVPDTQLMGRNSTHFGWTLSLATGGN